MISYAQAREDILLHRALHRVHHSNGFYIDVGAYHPTYDSVTKHFYENGWRGINIEPSRDLFPAFAEERPRDINIQAAVTEQAGEVTFFAVEGQLGTLDHKVAENHDNAGLTRNTYVVPAVTLTQICEQHAPRDIHFLKIDVEGHEAAALRGMDFQRFRPWVLVVEATEPNRLDLLTHHEWEGLIMTAGYTFVISDLPNRYYVANEHSYLAPTLAVPVDQYRLASDIRLIADLGQRLQHATESIAGGA